MADKAGLARVLSRSNLGGRLPQPHKVVNGEIAPVFEKQPVGTRSTAANHNDSCRELILDKMRLT